MIQFDLKGFELKDIEKKIFDEAVLITALINSRKGKITPEMALLLSMWENLKAKTDENGYISLYVSLINGGLTDHNLDGFIKRIKEKYSNLIEDRFKN